MLEQDQTTLDSESVDIISTCMQGLAYIYLLTEEIEAIDTGFGRENDS